MLAQIAIANPMRTLDPDFFPGETYYNGPGLQTLDPEFFRSKRGLLPYADEGEFGCVSLWGTSAQAVSVKLGRTVDNYCGGRPMIEWIPRPTYYLYYHGSYLYPSVSSNTYEPQGHYQVCCVRKGKRKRRRRPRALP
jgi:hypothetical protein